MTRFKFKDFDIQVLLFLASILSQNPAISAFLLLTLVFRTLVWPLLAPMMPTARLLELESAVKATYPLVKMQRQLSYNPHVRLNGFEREVLALFRMHLNVQQRSILGGYSWKEYCREIWSIWHGAKACRKRVDIFRVELEIAIVEEWEVRYGDVLRYYGMSGATGPISVPLQFHYPYRRV
ncbi:hypothetical protein IW262DRAFT_1452986 [Armillaria fumosa]|nr:hypothetical protein IW262DRAFT_1452986 [Armillaria fumosa]